MGKIGIPEIDVNQGEYINVVPDPPEVGVYVNGLFEGSSSVKVQVSKAGQYTVKLKAEGHKTYPDPDKRRTGANDHHKQPVGFNVGTYSISGILPAISTIPEPGITPPFTRLSVTGGLLHGTIAFILTRVKSLSRLTEPGSLISTLCLTLSSSWVSHMYLTWKIP